LNSKVKAFNINVNAEKCNQNDDTSTNQAFTNDNAYDTELKFDRLSKENDTPNNSVVGDMLPNDNTISAKSYHNFDPSSYLRDFSTSNVKIKEDLANNNAKNRNNFESSFSILSSKVQNEEINSKSLLTSRPKSAFKSVSFLNNFYDENKNISQLKEYDFTSKSFLLPNRYNFKLKKYIYLFHE
jgi:hypothetical protein